jgi:hypothetical protein
MPDAHEQTADRFRAMVHVPLTARFLDGSSLTARACALRRHTPQVVY